MNIAKKLKVGVVVLGATLSQSHAAALVPFAASGWNQDVVIGNGEAFTGRTATMDQGAGGGNNTWYGIGKNGAAPTTGLPTAVTTSLASPDLDFQLQSFTSNNAILNGGTLTLTVPTPLTRLALIGSNANGVSGDIIVTVNFSSGPSEVYHSTILGQDWANTTFSNAAFKSLGRVDVTAGTYNQVGVTNRMTLYQDIFTLGNVNNVVSVSIVNNGGGNNVIMALSGEINPIPEPSSMVLVGFSALGLISRRRR